MVKVSCRTARDFLVLFDCLSKGGKFSHHRENWPRRRGFRKLVFSVFFFCRGDFFLLPGHLHYFSRPFANAAKHSLSLGCQASSLITCVVPSTFLWCYYYSIPNNSTRLVGNVHQAFRPSPLSLFAPSAFSLRRSKGRRAVVRYVFVVLYIFLVRGRQTGERSRQSSTSCRQHGPHTSLVSILVRASALPILD